MSDALSGRSQLADRITASLAGAAEDIAVLFGDVRWTWGEIAAVADAVEAALVTAGAGPSDVVGLVLRNRPYGYAALLALIAHHRTVALISPFQPPAAIAADAVRLGLAALVAEADDATDDVAEAARVAGSALIALHRLTDSSSVAIRLSCTQSGQRTSLPDVAVQMLTSGTTGVPKRIPLGRRGLSQAIADQGRMAAAMGEAPASNAAEAALLQYAPMVQLSGLYNALQAAAERRQLILMEKFSPGLWLDTLRTHRQHMLALPPAMMRMVIEAAPSRDDFTSLRSVRSGAAPLDAQTRDRFEADYGVPVLGIYGATEFVGPIACWSLDDHAAFGSAKRGSVGRIWPSIAQGRIVDPGTGAALGPGGSGLLEVLVGRSGPDWIRTNDLATIDSDGFLFIHGRADDAINRGGFKIPPDIVSDALRTHPRVYDAATVPLPDARLGAVPAAVVELRHGDGDVGESDLIAYARTRLLAYQVPVRVLIVPALPRTPAQKISRPGLLALFEVDDPGK